MTYVCAFCRENYPTQRALVLHLRAWHAMEDLDMPPAWLGVALPLWLGLIGFVAFLGFLVMLAR